jgi:integrase
MTVNDTQLDFLAALEAPAPVELEPLLSPSVPTMTDPLPTVTPEVERPPAPPAAPPAARPATAPVTTLQAVCDRLHELDRPPQDLKKRASALRVLGKVLDRPLADIPSAPRQLSALIDDASPMLAGVNPRRWSNIRSLVRTSLPLAGVAVMPGRHTKGRSLAWQALAARLPSRSLDHGLSRLINYFSALSLQPDDIDGTALERFKRDFLETSIGRGPIARFNVIARAWTEAMRLVEGWPQVTLATIADERRYAMRWQELPPAFAADVEAMLAQACDPDPFSGRHVKPLRPQTIKQRRALLQRLATALLETGFPAANLTSLSVLTDPEKAKDALRFLIARAGGQPTATHASMAYSLTLIAKRWVKAPPEQIEELRSMTASLRNPQRGMTEKNRTRVRQVDIKANVTALLTLPKRVMQEVERHDDGDRKMAVRVMRALAIELLIVAPMRIRNLVELDIDRHIVRTRRGRDEQWRIVIAGEEVKNGVPIEAPLPPDTVVLLKTYLERYRGRIAEPVGRYLFPGREGACRDPSSVGEHLKQFVRRETGLVINVHLYRHIAGRLYLKANPSGIEVIRRMLGHTSSKITLRAYAELEANLAFADWGRTLGALREGRDPRTSRADRLMLSPAAAGREKGIF